MPFTVRKEATAYQIVGVMRRSPQEGHLIAVDDGTFFEVPHQYLIAHNPREGGYLTVGVHGGQGYIKPDALGEWEVLNPPILEDVAALAQNQLCFGCPLERCAGPQCPHLKQEDEPCQPQ